MDRAIVDLDDPETLAEASDRCDETTEGSISPAEPDHVRTSSVHGEANG
jgi:hypothetical protein